MFVTEEGAVVGSINVAELARLIDEGKVNPELVDPAALAAVEASRASAPEGDAADEDLSKLHKADLVERAEAAGFDPAGMTKAEIIDALENGWVDDVADDDQNNDEEPV
jgi:hypothetical protein